MLALPKMPFKRLFWNTIFSASNAGSLASSVLVSPVLTASMLKSA